MRTARTEHLEVLHILLEASDVHIDFKDNEGHTACHWAAAAGQVGALKLLHAFGADLDLVDSLVC